MRAAISFALMYAKDVGSNFARTQLESSGLVQDPHIAHVTPDMYSRWVDSLMQAVKRHDADYSLPLEQEWRTVLRQAVTLLS